MNISEEQAWLLQIDRKTKIAVGRLELIHIVSMPKYRDIPRCSEYCKRIILWNGKVVPVIDISVLINGVSTYYQTNKVAIAIYMNKKTGLYEYGGIQLVETPVLKMVNNNQIANRFQLPEKWHKYVISAFKENDEVTPIVDINKIFLKNTFRKDN